MSRPYNEIRLGQSHRLDVLIGATCGALLAAVVVYDFIQFAAEWLAR